MKQFDEILNTAYPKKICKRCGNYQSHTLVYCSGCGAKFVYQPETLLDALKATHNRDYQHRAVTLRPAYVAAIYKRALKKQGLSHQDFEKYILNKLEIND